MIKKQESEHGHNFCKLSIEMLMFQLCMPNELYQLFDSPWSFVIKLWRVKRFYLHVTAKSIYQLPVSRSPRSDISATRRHLGRTNGREVMVETVTLSIILLDA